MRFANGDTCLIEKKLDPTISQQRDRKWNEVDTKLLISRRQFISYQN